MSASDPIRNLLPLLLHVREVREGQWSAACPVASHSGKRRDNLSIGLGSDGQTVLLRCWAGHDAAQIVRALGLELKDLFPKRDLSPADRCAYGRVARLKEARRVLQHELIVLQQVNDATLNHWPVLDPSPWDRELLAVLRIRNALEALYGTHQRRAA